MKTVSVHGLYDHVKSHVSLQRCCHRRNYTTISSLILQKICSCIIQLPIYSCSVAMALHVPRLLLHHNSHLSLHTCSTVHAAKYISSTRKLLQFQSQVHAKSSKHGGISFVCRARRRVRYVDGDEEGDDEYGDNMEIAKLETYSEKKTKEALLVKATVDAEEELVLIFKVATHSENYHPSIYSQ